MKSFARFICIMLFFYGNVLPGINIQKISEVTLDQEKTIISRGWAISVKNPETLILVDQKDKTIKLFANSGKYLGVWIEHGFGPKETAKPYMIDYRDKKFALIDTGKNRYFVYKDTGNNGLETIKTIITPAMGHDIKLEGKKVFIAGYKTDEKNECYGLFSVNLQTDEIDYWIPYYNLYGCNSFKEFTAKLDSINPVGRGCYFDVDNNFAYIVWKGKPEIMAIDLKTKKVNSFSHKSINYKMIKITKKFLEYSNGMNVKGVRSELQKYSLVTGIFIDHSFAALLYANHNNHLPGWQTFIQFYTRQGKFLNEKKLDGAIINDHFAIKTFYYDKEKNILYFLSRTIDNDLHDIYKLIKYKIGQ